MGKTVEAKSERHVVRNGEQEQVERDLSAEASVGHKSARDRPLRNVGPARAVHVDVVEEDAEQREPDDRESEQREQETHETLGEECDERERGRDPVQEDHDPAVREAERGEPVRGVILPPLADRPTDEPARGGHKSRVEDR